MWLKLRRQSRARKAEADLALKSAQAAKESVEADGATVTSLHNAMKEIRERNHFIEQLQEIVDRRGGKFNEG